MKQIAIFGGMVVFMLLTACGSGGSSGSNITANASQASVQDRSAFLAFQKVNKSNTDDSSPVALVKALAKKAIQTSSYSFNCSELSSYLGATSGSGLVSSTIRINDSTFELVDSRVDYQDCTFNGLTIESNGETCTVDYVLDGAMTMTQENDNSLRIKTDAACNSLHVSLNSVSNSLGLDMLVNSDSDSITGNICINGTTFDIEELLSSIEDDADINICSL